MQAAPIFFLGLTNFMTFLTGGSFLGMPPGERDAAYLQCAPAEVLIYQEWAERAPVKEGADGLEGFAADPEVQQFVSDVRKAILTTLDREMAGSGPEEEILKKSIPPLVLAGLKHSGCLYLSYDAEAIKKLAEMQTELQNQPGARLDTWLKIVGGLKGTLIINGGEDAEEIAKHLSELVKLLPEGDRKENLQKQPLPVPHPNLKLTLHRHENYFLLSYGEGSLERALKGLKGEAEGLGASDRFQKAFKKVELKRTGKVSWLDVQGILNTVSQVMGVQGAMVESMAQLAGADGIKYSVSATGLVDGQEHSKQLIFTGDRKEGVLALAEGRSIRADDLKYVPADADFVTAFSLNGPKILSETRKVISSAGAGPAQSFEGILNQLAEELGFSLEDDVFEGFGDVWVVYDSPSGGGLFVSGAVASLEVRDPQKAYTVFTQLMKVLKDSLPGEIEGGYNRRAMYLAQKKFLDRTIYYVNTVGDEEVPFAPAFCVTDKQLLAGPHPQALKAHLRFLESDLPNFASKHGDGLEMSEEGRLLSFCHVGTKWLVEVFYAFVPYIGQVMMSEMQSNRVDIDVFSIPSARGVLPYLEDSRSTMVRTPEGILCESHGGLPFINGSSLLLNTVTPYLMFYFSVRGRVVPGVGEVDEADPIQPGETVPLEKVKVVVQKAVSRAFSSESSREDWLSSGQDFTLRRFSVLPGQSDTKKEFSGKSVVSASSSASE